VLLYDLINHHFTIDTLKEELQAPNIDEDKPDVTIGEFVSRIWARLCHSLTQTFDCSPWNETFPAAESGPLLHALCHQANVPELYRILEITKIQLGCSTAPNLKLLSPANSTDAEELTKYILQLRKTPIDSSILALRLNTPNIAGKTAMELAFQTRRDRIRMSSQTMLLLAAGGAALPSPLVCSTEEQNPQRMPTHNEQVLARWVKDQAIGDAEYARWANELSGTIRQSFTSYVV